MTPPQDLVWAWMRHWARVQKEQGPPAPWADLLTSAQGLAVRYWRHFPVLAEPGKDASTGCQPPGWAE